MVVVCPLAVVSANKQMKIESIELVGVRSFQDSGRLQLSENCNIFVGLNNAGKSTILRGILHWQGQGFSAIDRRQGQAPSYLEATFRDLDRSHPVAIGGMQERTRLVRVFDGSYVNDDQNIHYVIINNDSPAFQTRRPNHLIAPFLARRKAMSFNQAINTETHAQVDGTFSNLYSLIDEVATSGHPDHERFKSALDEIVGLKVTTRASQNGKEAGIYLGRRDFVTLDRMGDGVTEMVGLIAALCVEENKIFLLEEPETNLHPRALKALLGMVREAQRTNQFVVATHSNIVIRELGSTDGARIFRVYREGSGVMDPSKVDELRQDDPVARLEVLRELGYEFGDLGLHDAWLFLEESSAERVIRDVLIPSFAPALKNRLRTFSAGGVTNVEPSVSEFRRLIAFVHLQPVYEGLMWVRVDGDSSGSKVIRNLKEKYPRLDAESFSRADFELYYPAQFCQRCAQHSWHAER